MYLLFFSLCLLLGSLLSGLELGIDRLLQEKEWQTLLKGKRVALLTHQAAINAEGILSTRLMKEAAQRGDFQLVALFAPEHGLYGLAQSGESIKDSKDPTGIPIYSLHGANKRPSAENLKNIDFVICDLQDIGCRSYTFATTLCYLMEECAKAKVAVIVTDRPNPMGGLIVDGPLSELPKRNFFCYAPLPYVHGMTLGEVAQLFNGECQVGCCLYVVPMRGWKRGQTFSQCHLPWVPPSPQIPEADTPFFYATSGVIGELELVNIGIGYTLPFKVVAAPWLSAELFAEKLNNCQFPGVLFCPVHYTPLFGSYKGIPCHGVKIIVTNPKQFCPVQTSFLLLGILKTLYPGEFQKILVEGEAKKIFSKYYGTEKIFQILKEQKYAVFPLKEICKDAAATFLPIRAKYLIPSY